TGARRPARAQAERRAWGGTRRTGQERSLGPLLFFLRYARRMKTLTAALVAILVAIAARTAPPYPVAVKVADKGQAKAPPFPLESVRLLDGPFRSAMINDQEYLLSLDLDRLLHNF